MKYLKIGFLLPLLFLTLLLDACFSSLPVADNASPSSTPIASIVVDTPASSSPKIIVTVATPHIDQPPDGNITQALPTDSTCGYQWAYHDLVELTTEVQQALQALQPTAEVKVFAFGEDCVYADGHKTFSAMETDFNITLQVTDLQNTAGLGEWIVKVMQIILNIPPDQLMGPRPGRVSILYQAGQQNEGLNFYIDQYRSLPPNLSNAEIYDKLKTP